MPEQDKREDPQTRVGHCKADPVDVYIGRGAGGRDMLETPIGKPGWLGNPHTVEDHGREGSIERFRKAFEHRLETDAEFRARVRDLAGKRLGCWCQRLDEDAPACHGEVIAEHADRLAREGDLVTDGGRSEAATDQSGSVRKHFYLITEHEEQDRVGGVSIYDSRFSQGKKNEEAPVTVHDDEKEGFSQVGKKVALGYHDFQDEAAYEDNDHVVEVMKQKVRSVDRHWAEKAGIAEVVYDE